MLMSLLEKIYFFCLSTNIYLLGPLGVHIQVGKTDVKQLFLQLMWQYMTGACLEPEFRSVFLKNECLSWDLKDDKELPKWGFQAKGLRL